LRRKEEEERKEEKEEKERNKMSPFFDLVAGFATARIFVKVFESS